MSKATEAIPQSVEPEQIIAPDDSSSDNLEVHTIPDKYYGAATRAAISNPKSDASDMAPKVSTDGKKKSPVMWIVLGIVLVVLASAAGFVYFNQSLLFGSNQTEPPVQQVIDTLPTLPTPPVAPSAPSGVYATATSPTGAQLNWMDTSSNEAGFRIERREPTTEFVAITSLPPNSTAYQDRTVSPEKDYLYRVIATNEGGDSPSSNEGAVRTPAEPPPPEQPAKLPPAGLDSDSDGLTDLEEANYGTGANTPDTDGDSFLDGNEVFHLYNPASGSNTRLLDTGMVKVVDSPAGWSLYVPIVWKVNVANDGMSAVITSGHGETFHFSMESNRNRQPLLDWYLAGHPGVLSTQTASVMTKSGIAGLEGVDKLTTYFAWGEWVLAFQYNLDGQPFVNFRTTYEMMKNSLKLTREPSVSTEMIQSYDAQHPQATMPSSTENGGATIPSDTSSTDEAGEASSVQATTTTATSAEMSSSSTMP